MAKLVFLDKNFAGRVYELVLEKTTVGRGDQNTLAIHHDSVSAAHCEILMHGSEIIVRDLDSRNGTFVQGMRLNKQSQLKSGQTVIFGSVQARLEMQPAKTEDDTADITAIYTLGKVMREQRAQNQAPPVAAFAQLEPHAGSAQGNNPTHGDHTMMLSKTSSPAPEEPVPAPSQTVVQQPGSKGISRLAVALLVLGLLVVFWLLWRNR